MAEAYFRKLTEGDWECMSAGTQPTGYVHPLAITALAEDGIDITGHESKSVSAFGTQDWDYVVTVCDDAAETCPVFAGTEQVLHWPFPDPADARGNHEEQLIAFREARDAIKCRVVEFLGTLKSD